MGELGNNPFAKTTATQGLLLFAPHLLSFPLLCREAEASQATSCPAGVLLCVELLKSIKGFSYEKKKRPRFQVNVTKYSET